MFALHFKLLFMVRVIDRGYMLGLSLVRKANLMSMLAGGALVWGSFYSAAAVSWVINDDAQVQPSELASDIAAPKDFAASLSAEDSLSEAQFDQQHRETQEAIRAYQAKLRPHWPDAWTSDAIQWVSYSDDFQIRRRVDFRANTVGITLFSADGDTEDFKETRKVVTQELEGLLSMTVAQAMANDPIFSPAFAEYAATTEYGQALVFSELFSTDKPGDRVINRLARSMMQKVQVEFYEQGAAVQVPVRLSKKLTYTIPLPDNRLKKKAKQFRPHILEAAKAMEVPVDLVYAVIHTESHFNPLARSPIPAYGLMQIVPRTAGRDATRLLYDKSRLLSPAYLFDPEKNIKVGAAYLRLLYFHYLKDIKDPKSRLYCAIAAYNTGVANVARVFGNKPAMDNAASHINELSAQQVLAALLESLPARETRDYLKKVLARKSLYSQV